MLEAYEYSLNPSQETVVVPCLTDVPLPMELDMRNSEEVIDLLQALLFEEASRGKGYYGAFLLGSLSRGTAHNGSDIDLIHVVERYWEQANAIRRRLHFIFGELYGVQVDWRGFGTCVGLEETLSFDRYSDRDSSLQLLGKETVTMIKDERMREEIVRGVSLDVLPAFSEQRTSKLRAVKTSPPKKLNMGSLSVGVSPWVRLW